MKQSGIYVCITVILLAIAVPGFTYDLRDGFYDLKWGSRISQLPGYTKLREKGPVTYYRNLNKAYTIDTTLIQHVVYGCYENRLFAIYLHVESPDVFSKLRDYMTTKYGDPKQALTLKREQTIYTWDYQTVKIKLKRYEKEGNMKLGFYYIPLSKRLNEDQQERFLDKSIKFFPIEKDKVPEAIPLLRF